MQSCNCSLNKNNNPNQDLATDFHTLILHRRNSTNQEKRALASCKHQTTFRTLRDKREERFPLGLRAILDLDRISPAASFQLVQHSIQ
jgi:hypothetical protein